MKWMARIKEDEADEVDSDDTEDEYYTYLAQ